MNEKKRIFLCISLAYSYLCSIIDEQKLMKKIIIAVVCALAIAGCNQKKGQTEGGADRDSLLADSLRADSVISQIAKVSPEDIEVDWANKEIPVEKGGKKPELITLLQAFNKVWPTEVVDDLLDYAKDSKFTEKMNGETGGAIVMDRKNGYAEVVQGDAPGDNMSAAVWGRKDGNLLFIINIVRLDKEDDERTQQAICAYDYNPASETLTPERNAIIRFRQTAGLTTTYKLPREGKDVSIVERDKDFHGTFHIFTWDGQYFSKENTISEEKLTKALNGTWTCNEEGKPKLSFKITNDDETYCSITDCNVDGMTEYEAAANAFDGFLHIYEVSAPEENNIYPAIKCKFRLLKNGKLQGSYYLRTDEGKELNGEMTLQKVSALGQYAE
jgi:uncharacterized lipoprotein YajG